MKKYKRNQKIKHYNEGKNNPNYIDGRKNKKYYCLDCEKKISSYQHKRCHSCAHKFRNKKFKASMLGKKHSKEAKEKIRQKAIERYKNPKNNPNYIHGKGNEPYPLEFNESLRQKIRKRDNYTCQKCGKKQSELKGFFKKLDVHHIDYNKENLKPDNLISLCHKCNVKVNKDRDYWFAYFTYIREV